MVEILDLLASRGIACRYEISGILAQKLNISPRAGSLQNLYIDLVNADLICADTFPVCFHSKLAGIRLTEKGKKLCHDFGWQVVESEWERLITHHSGSKQPRHTGAVLAFAHNARMRGWQVQVVPDTGVINFFPDARVEKDGKAILVEVELGVRKEPKWTLMGARQGYVALCAKTPESRASRIQECRSVGVGGMATDLHTLIKSRSETDSPLWVETWK